MTLLLFIFMICAHIPWASFMPIEGATEKTILIQKGLIIFQILSLIIYVLIGLDSLNIVDVF